MPQRLSTRIWAAAALAVATGAMLLALGAGMEAALVALAAVGAAAALAGGGVAEAARFAAPVQEASDAAPLPAVLEEIADPLLLVRAGRVSLANSAARRLLGGHVVGEDVRIAIRHPAAAERFAAAEDTGAPVEIVGVGGGERRWLLRVAAVAPGIRLVQLSDQSGHHAAERMRMDFVANASHELRTPLAAILGYVETLRDHAGEDAAVRERFLGIVFAEARRMEQLVEDLMSLSRIEAEKFRRPGAAIDLTALVREVRDALTAAQPARGGDIVLELTDDVPAVIGERAQLSQLLHNLIGNAMKYGRAGTPIRVHVARGEDDDVCLVVADEGDGIPAAHLPRLTERFYRVDAGRSRQLGGTGLGLAIVKHIVERHRGRLNITSTPGIGTRVTVTLRTRLA